MGRRRELDRDRSTPPHPRGTPVIKLLLGGALAACSYISKGMGAQFLLATTRRCSGRLRWSMTARASLSTTTTAAGQRSPEAWRCLASWRSRRSGTSSPTETYRRPCCRQCASRTSRDLQPWQTVGQAQDEPTRAGRTRPPRRERTAPRLSYPTWSRPSDAPLRANHARIRHAPYTAILAAEDRMHPISQHTFRLASELHICTISQHIGR